MEHTSNARADAQCSRLLTTKQLPEITGLSKSFFEKGRIYGYGPKYLKIKSSSRHGKILYRETDVLNWLAAQACDPEVLGDE